MTHAENPPSDLVSALVDDALAGEARSRVMAELLTYEDAALQWHRYHVIGDVLRSQELACAKGDWAFLQRLDARLAQEPKPQMDSPAYAVAVPKPVSSANQSVFMWRAVAGLACVALAGVMGMSLWPSPVNPMVAVESSNGVMIRDAQLDELMAAHQQLAGHSALQLPAGFLRNATHDGAHAK